MQSVREQLVDIICKEAKEFVTKDTEESEVPVQIMEDTDIKDMAKGIADKIMEVWELAP